MGAGHHPCQIVFLSDRAHETVQPSRQADRTPRTGCSCGRSSVGRASALFRARDGSPLARSRSSDERGSQEARHRIAAIAADDSSLAVKATAGDTVMTHGTVMIGAARDRSSADVLIRHLSKGLGDRPVQRGSPPSICYTRPHVRPIAIALAVRIVTAQASPPQSGAAPPQTRAPRTCRRAGG
jgi:hypothetical protein